MRLSAHAAVHVSPLLSLMCALVVKVVEVHFFQIWLSTLVVYHSCCTPSQRTVKPGKLKFLASLFTACMSAAITFV